MADLRMRVLYDFTIDSIEFRLLCKALRGTLDEKDKAAALALQEKLLLERARLTDHIANEAAKAEENILRAHNNGPTKK